MSDTLPHFPSKPHAYEIETLIDRLYEAKRELQSETPCAVGGPDHHKHPHFVLIARGEGQRQEFENRVFAYFTNKYGFDMANKPTYDVHPLGHVSTFCFPNGVTVSVINL